MSRSVRLFKSGLDSSPSSLNLPFLLILTLISGLSCREHSSSLLSAVNGDLVVSLAAILPTTLLSDFNFCSHFSARFKLSIFRLKRSMFRCPVQLPSAVGFICLLLLSSQLSSPLMGFHSLTRLFPVKNPEAMPRWHLSWVIPASFVT